MTSRFGKPWSTPEDAILQANPRLTNREVSALLPGRTPEACRCRRSLLGGAGARKNGRPPAAPATEAEDAILRANVGRPLASYQSQLPGRTEYWIFNRRAELGLRRPRYEQPPRKEAAVEPDGKQLEPEGTAYRTRSGQPARIINRFPMPDVPSVYGGNHGMP
jgi:hypothetical protein